MDVNGVYLTSENFEEEVLRSKLPVLVDFYAGRCGPCRMLLPVMEDVAKELAGKVRVFLVNTDEQPKLASRFHVNTVPTVILFRNGVRVDSSIGYKSKQQLLSLLW